MKTRVFMVGKKYEPYQADLGTMRVVRRTDKTIWCEKDFVQWRMKIRTDANGNEYAVETSVPTTWRDAFTYYA